MAIIGSKRKDMKFVGVQIPPQTHNHLTLHCLANGVSKAQLIKKLIEDWCTVQPEAEGVLIQTIVKKANKEWKSWKRKHPRASHSEFKSLLRKELTWKGLNTDQIDTIISQIKG
jgi:hypothetical protein